LIFYFLKYNKRIKLIGVKIMSIKLGISGLLGAAVLIGGFLSVYTVEEGHTGIVKRFGEAIKSTSPGVHMKMPIIDSVTEMEVRTRKYQLKMTASTTGKTEGGLVELQMPSTVIISANWNIPKESALEIYKVYGGLEQYEDRILDPRVIRATKQIFAKHSIESIIGSREIVRNEIASTLEEALEGKLAKMSDINIEDVQFGKKIRDAIENKQTAKLDFEAEQYNLDKQNLEAQRSVNTAVANASSIDKNSIAKAAAIQREGEAEANSMKAKASVLAVNPQLIELIKAERWNGQMPTTLMGGDTSGILLNVDTNK
jgi:regulator of protease activity HflC (stomatin/prohibitin superfamily)